MPIILYFCHFIFPIWDDSAFGDRAWIWTQDCLAAKIWLLSHCLSVKIDVSRHQTSTTLKLSGTPGDLQWRRFYSKAHFCFREREVHLLRAPPLPAAQKGTFYSLVNSEDWGTPFLQVFWGLFRREQSRVVLRSLYSHDAVKRMFQCTSQEVAEHTTDFWPDAMILFMFP